MDRPEGFADISQVTHERVLQTRSQRDRRQSGNRAAGFLSDKRDGTGCGRQQDKRDLLTNQRPVVGQKDSEFRILKLAGVADEILAGTISILRSAKVQQQQQKWKRHRHRFAHQRKGEQSERQSVIKLRIESGSRDVRPPAPVVARASGLWTLDLDFGLSTHTPRMRASPGGQKCAEDILSL